MTREPTTRLQVSAHRFQARRMERALRCGQPSGDPAPGGLAAGGLLGAVAVAGAALLAVLAPQSGLGDAPILLDRASGALYVRVGGTVHPVFNLASARLITGTAADPRPVGGSAISRARRGPSLGIPGAPGVLGPALDDTATWSICDDGAVGTTLIAGVDASPSRRIDPEEAVAVRSESGTDYLLRSGRRAPAWQTPVVQRGSTEERRSWDRRMDPVVPRRVSALLLNVVPEVAPIDAVPAALPVALPPAATTLCVHWRAGDPDGITLSAGMGLPLPAGAVPTVLAQADGPGPALDAVYLPPGHSAYVRGDTGPGYLIADTGVRFTVAGAVAARSLGLPDAPVAVPWSMLAGLPAGPLLGAEQAGATRDVVPGR